MKTYFKKGEYYMCHRDLLCDTGYGCARLYEGCVYECVEDNKLKARDGIYELKDENLLKYFEFVIIPDKSKSYDKYLECLWKEFFALHPEILNDLKEK